MREWDNCDRNIDKYLVGICGMKSCGIHTCLLVQLRLSQTYWHCHQKSVLPGQRSMRLNITRQQHFVNIYKTLAVRNIHDLLPFCINVTDGIFSGANSRNFLNAFVGPLCCLLLFTLVYFSCFKDLLLCI
jgi:hypothetical protein